MATNFQRVRRFHEKMGLPVRDEPGEPTLEERILRGKLLLEETVETIVKGLGLAIETRDILNLDPAQFNLVEHPMKPGYDPVETLDGLADVKVIANGTAVQFGLPMEEADDIVNDSNMSKLDEYGRPIINGISDGAREGEDKFDPTKPIGKLLKGVNWFDAAPKIAKLLGKVI